jgi:hypothetical protein
LAGQGINQTLRLTLREGSVYYFAERHLTSPEPHYFIVVNSDPLAQQVLVLSVVTSKVDDVKLRRKACPETLVELAPNVFDVLKKTVRCGLQRPQTSPACRIQWQVRAQRNSLLRQGFAGGIAESPSQSHSRQHHSPR